MTEKLLSKEMELYRPFLTPTTPDTFTAMVKTIAPLSYRLEQGQQLKKEN